MSCRRRSRTKFTVTNAKALVSFAYLTPKLQKAPIHAEGANRLQVPDAILRSIEGRNLHGIGREPGCLEFVNPRIEANAISRYYSLVSTRRTKEFCEGR